MRNRIVLVLVGIAALSVLLAMPKKKDRATHLGLSPAFAVAAHVSEGTPSASPTASPAPSASVGISHDAPGHATVFGATGPVTLSDLPRGRFRREIEKLDAPTRSQVLSRLGQLQVPIADAASLFVTSQGALHYGCLPPPPPSTILSAAAAAPDPAIAAAAVPLSSPPVRHSRPGAGKVIYLDFSGHTITGTEWNSFYETPTYAAKAFNLDGDATTFSDQEQQVIVRIWERVAEDFAPFDVDVTTEEPAAFNRYTGRILITESRDQNGTSMPRADTFAGVAYLDVFGKSDYATRYSPALVYADKLYFREDYLAEIASHEIGHNLALAHDGTPSEEYYRGHGSGDTSWGPIMGAAYERNVTQWSKGDYTNHENKSGSAQDDLALIAARLGHVPDEAGDTPASATPLTVTGSTFSSSGVISQTGEVDLYSFTVTTGGTYQIDARPFRSAAYVHGGNLDITLALRDSTQATITSANPQSTSSSLSAYLVPGDYFVRVAPSASGDPLASWPTGYTIYGSLGRYTITSTFTPPSTPVFSNVSPSRTAYIGETISLSAVATGTPSPSHRWQRLAAGAGAWTDLNDGDGYSGTFTGTLSLAISTSRHGDQYRCVATNAAGSVFSTPATLTVLSPTLPSFGTPPGPFALSYNASIGFYLFVSGVPTPTLQWKRNGIALAGQTSSYLSLHNLTPADSGGYTLTATNPAGTVTSDPIQITVAAPQPPRIVTQPVGVAVAESYIASVSVGAVGDGALSYQWYRNNVPLPGATNSSVHFYAAKASDTGIYHVRITNVAGSIVSQPAQITILPPELPEITFPSYRITGTYLGQSLYLSPYITGSPTITLQWFKDDQPIPGATSPYHYLNLVMSNAGRYRLRATNAAGTVFSQELIVTWNAPDRRWVATERVGDVVFFLESSPGRIHRYDLAQESWLPVVPLPAGKVPTGFWPTATGTFVIYPNELAWRSADLATETLVATTSSQFGNLVGVGDYVLYVDGSYYDTVVRSRRISDRTPGPTFAPPTAVEFVGQSRPAVAAQARHLFTSQPTFSPNKIVRYTVAADGTLTQRLESPYHSTFSTGDRRFVSPDESKVFDSAGGIFRTSDLRYAGGVGAPFDLMDFFADQSLVLTRGRMLSLLDPSGQKEQGKLQLADVPWTLAVRDGNVFAFSAPAAPAALPGVTKVARTDLTASSLQTTPAPQYTRLSLDNAFVDPSGVLHVLSNSAKGIVRWSTASRSFLPTLSLRGRPRLSDYAPAENRFVMAYADGAITEIRPGEDDGETPVAHHPSRNLSRKLLAFGNLTALNLQKGESGGDFRLTLNDVGLPAELSEAFLYFGESLAWHSTTRRAYSFSSSAEGIETAAVDANGTWESPVALQPNLSPPLRFNDTGSLILAANGRVVNQNLAPIADLANSVLDGVWLDAGLFTVRALPEGIELQRWSQGNYALTGTVVLPGHPARIFRLGDQRLAILAWWDGYLAVHIVSADLAGVESFYNSPNPPPAFVHHPRPTVAAAFAYTTFSVTGTGPNLSYRWQIGENGLWRDLQDEARWSGTRTGTLSIAPWAAAQLHNTQFRCIITNSSGSTISDGATLIVRHSVPATGDFNLDGNTDLLWRNLISGQVTAWFLDGARFAGSGTMGTVALDWQSAGTGDFNGDGKTDLLWRNAFSGQVAAWFMNGSAFAGSASLGYVSLDWQSIGTGDFNHDGKIDLLWRSLSTGEVAVWFMNGATFAGSASLGQVSLDWQTAGTGDFNFDGHTDLLWRSRTTGQVAAWFMDRAAFAGSVSLGYVSLDWANAGTGDFNHDNHTDLLWRNLSTGEVAVWFLDRGIFAGSSSLGTISLDWQY